VLIRRLGLQVPPVQPGAVWVHAASVGEIGAAWNLVRELPDPVLLTADTPAGVAHAARLAAGRPGVATGPRPLDLGWTLAPLWAEARPRLVVFVEGTFWPGLAWTARRAGVPVARVSCKVGARTRRFRPALSRWWAPVDLVLARDPESAAFLAGVHRCPVEVGGDLKAAGAVPANPLRWPGPFAVGASTRAGDDQRLLDAVDRVGEPLRVLLAPRHPDRFDPRVLEGRRWARRSALGDQVPDDVDVVVLDTLGELAGALVGARFAFVGGTFDPAIGGHSPWEAAAAGVPVVAGPHVAGQGDAFARVGASVGPDLLTAIRAAAPPRVVRASARAVADRLLALAGAPAPESSPRPWARGAAAAYGLATALREQVRSGPARVPVPVISVGSTNARGPGKTSTVRALVGALRERGHQPGVAIRGYRRADRSGRVRVSWETPTVEALGDEGMVLLAAGAEVAAGPDRVGAARRLVERGCTVVVLDDGLQHRRLHRDLDVAVVDARYPGARGLIPAGERREVEVAPARAHLVLVHHAGGGFSFPGEAVERRPGPWIRGDGGAGAPEGPVAAVAGIARAADFFASLELPVARTRALADHQPVDDDLARDLLSWADGRPIVCTHKDAVRLPPWLRARAAWRDVEIALPQRLLERLPVAPACDASPSRIPRSAADDGVPRGEDAR
jgi:tetraacyldisaccharide 4'-kinase